MLLGATFAVTILLLLPRLLLIAMHAMPRCMLHAMSPRALLLRARMLAVAKKLVCAHVQKILLVVLHRRLVGDHQMDKSTACTHARSMMEAGLGCVAPTTTTERRGSPMAFRVRLLSQGFDSSTQALS